MLTFSSRLLTNDTIPFSIQGPKISVITIIAIGPIKVDIRVVNHGEWLNHDSNHPC